jgi:hypothetical protein
MTIHSIVWISFNATVALYVSCTATNTVRWKLKPVQKVTSAVSRLCATYLVYSANCFSSATRVQLLSLTERSSCIRILQQMAKVQKLLVVVACCALLLSRTATRYYNRHESLYKMCKVQKLFTAGRITGLLALIWRKNGHKILQSVSTVNIVGNIIGIRWCWF